jgi:ABC-type transport system involved in multi-copper enzyme maturation permease subunit
MIRTWVIARIVWIEMRRRKDAYVLAILLGGLLLALVSLNVFGLGGTAGYVKDVGLLGVWVCGWALAAAVGARQIPQEERRGTIYPMLSKPITRGEFLLGKWLGAWGATTAALAAFYGAVWAVVAARGASFSPVALAQGYALHAAAMAVVTALAIALSTRLTSGAAATTTWVVTGAAFLIVPRVPEFLALEKGVSAAGLLVLYYALPHFEAFDMRRRLVYDFGPAGGAYVGAALLYGAALTAALLLLAWIGFRRKKFDREEVG